MADRPRIRVEPGQRYGNLTVTAAVAGVMSHVPCRCDCGRTSSPRMTSLRNGDTRSCGCLHGADPGDIDYPARSRQARALRDSGLPWAAVAEQIGVASASVARQISRRYLDA